MRHPFPLPGNFWLHDLFWLLIVIALIAGVILVVRMLMQRPSTPGGAAGPRPHPPHLQALAELDLRYARGEVDRPEYLQRRADLLGMPPPEAPLPGVTPRSPQP